jgi:acetoin utilization deacetylase AcuC-like enzyme
LTCNRATIAPQLSRRAFLTHLSAGVAVGGLAAVLPSSCRPAPETLPLDSGADAWASLDAQPGVGTGWVYDDLYLQHPHATERPERLTYIKQRLTAAGLITHLESVTALADPSPYIAKIHSSQHISQIGKLPQTGLVAAAAVAGALGAVKTVCSGEAQNAFCAIRPPGHHARNAGGEAGFCYYGNVAIAARYAQAAFKIQRVLIVDWDYHHGDGTEWAFYDDPSVLFFSTHNRNAYPNTGDPARRGAGAGLGYNINVHLGPGAGDDDFVKVFDQKLAPAAAAFKPQLVLISAGFDSKQNDQLGTFALTPCGFSTLTQKVMAIAKAHAGGRLVSLLEGGYADAGSSYTYNGLARSVEAHVATLLDGQLHDCS